MTGVQTCALPISLYAFAPMLYRIGALHDVQVGSNAFEPGTGFLSTPGYDAPTGLGTPNVGVLLSVIG